MLCTKIRPHYQTDKDIYFSFILAGILKFAFLFYVITLNTESEHLFKYVKHEFTHVSDLENGVLNKKNRIK